MVAFTINKRRVDGHLATVTSSWGSISECPRAPTDFNEFANIQNEW
jgi:hypothetical protein